MLVSAARMLGTIGLVLACLATADLPTNVPQCKFQSQPGIEYLGTGVDLTSFVPRVGAVEELKHHVVQLTCNGGGKWTNPYTNTSYAIWDQIESILGDPSSARQGLFFKYSNTFEFSEHFEESVSTGGLFGLFSASEEFEQTFRLATQLSASLKYDYGKVNAFVAMLSSQLSPSQEYLQAAEDLPVLWWLPTSWPKVENLMSQFGTHFVWKVALGGEYRYFSACESAYLHAAGDAHADAQAQLDFLFLLTADGGASGSAVASETAYQAACTRKISCIGGDQSSCNVNTTAGWAKFVKSVDTTPGPGLTRAYYNLNADLLKTWHPIRHILVRDATIAYIAWSGLEKLFAFYEASRAVLTKIASTPAPACFVASLTEVTDPFFGDVEATDLKCGTEPYRGSVDFRTSTCVKFGASGDPQVAVSNAKAWAAHLLNATALHYSEMSTALAGRITSQQIHGWIGKAKAWLGSFALMTEKVYSFPTPFTCLGTCDVAPQLCCELCCFGAGESCSCRRLRAANVSAAPRAKDGNKECVGGAPCSESVTLPVAMTVAPPEAATEIVV